MFFFFWMTTLIPESSHPSCSPGTLGCSRGVKSPTVLSWSLTFIYCRSCIVKNEWSLTSIPPDTIVSCLLSVFLNDRLSKDHVVVFNAIFALEIYPKDGRSFCYNTLQNCTKLYGVKYQKTIILIQTRAPVDLTNKCVYHIALQISHVMA